MGSSVSSDVADDRVLYVLEGLIGVGKTRLSKKAAEQGYNVLEERINDKMLQMFYDDSSRYGFTFQCFMLLSRQYQYRLHKQMQTPVRNVSDRSLLGDYVFALCNFLLGHISCEEMEAYEHELQITADRLTELSFLKDVTHLIMLDDAPEACKQRVECVRRNPLESGIPLSYYEAIDDVYFFLIRSLLHCPHFRHKLSVFRWGQYDDWTQVQQGLYCRHRSSGKHSMLYNDPEIIRCDYMRYCVQKQALEHSLKEVSFLSDIMDRDASAGWPKSSDKSSKRTAYAALVWRKCNEYKRLVYFYLSEAVNVKFIDSQ